MPFFDFQNMACISSYADAYEHWHANFRYDGKKERHWAPLDGVRKPHAALLNANADDAFIARLYDTNMVVYYADGGVSITTHDSSTSRAFLDNVLPPGCSAFAHSGSTYITATLRGETHYFGQGRTFLRQGPDGRLDVIATPERVEHTFDQKKLATLRKKLKPFVDWKRSVERLSGKKAVLGLGGLSASAALKSILSEPDEWRWLLPYTTESIVRSVASAVGAHTSTSVPSTQPPKAARATLLGVSL